MSIFWTFASRKKRLLSTLVGKKIVFQGDSIVAGAGVDDDHKFSTLVCNNLGATQVNQGQSGKTLQTGNATGCGFPYFDITTIPTFDSTYGLYILALGVNDIQMFNGTYTTTAFLQKMNDTVDALINKGWANDRIMLCAPHYLNVNQTHANYGCGSSNWDQQRYDDYHAIALSVAQSRHTLYCDLRQALARTSDPNSYLLDGIHPGIAGSQLVADYITEPEAYFVK